jgi:hypothetical protein
MVNVPCLSLGMKYLVIALVVALVLVGGGYLYLQDDGDIASSVVSDEVITDPYAGWEIYRNDDIGYSIRYPAGYDVREPREEDLVSVQIPIEELLPGAREIIYPEYDGEIYVGPKVTSVHSVTFRDEFPLANLRLSLDSYDNPDGLTAKEWSEDIGIGDLAKALQFDGRGGVYKAITVNGLEGIWAEVSSDYGSSITVVVGNERNIFTIDGSLDFSDEDSTLSIGRFVDLINSIQVD